MATASEYRKYAKGCLELSDMAETADQRQSFLNMAREWNLAAMRLDGTLPVEQVSPPGGSAGPNKTE